MADSYGNYNPTVANEFASGKMVDAGVRAFTKIFDLAADEDAAGGTSNRLHVGRIVRGSVIQAEFKVATGANLSAINLSLGTGGSAADHMAATAGPNNTTASYSILPAKQGVALTEDTDLYLTPSGNLPSTGRIVVTIYASKR